MIHDEPIIRRLGDCYVTVEFGDTMDLSQNFRVHSLAAVLGRSAPAGVVEVVPHLRSLGVVLDRRTTSPQRIEEALADALGEIEEVATLPSRVFRLPVWYDDPWSERLAEQFEVEHNLDLVARENGLTRQEAIERHANTEQWVAAVGFVPGCFWTIALDPGRVLTAPKYRIPRDRTPSRALALAGITTTIYPYPGPGGYQCIGRCAVDVYRLGSENALFGPDGVLVRPGDRHVYVPVDPFEYEEIRERCAAGTYEYDVVEDEFAVPTPATAGVPA